ncbi:MAG: hypothetical protein NZ772_00150 [Cyanobacteria bacterium]|nr:hypothetical protein [Cyanobacteriota bacterium]MDW8199609.1 hypothetical protein [Cyanobacteriota bacterium SKYGB_h_bin112]
MSSSEFESVLAAYDLALTTLEKSEKPGAEEALAVLRVRDRVQSMLMADNSTANLVQLIQLDSRLRNGRDKFLSAIDLESVRISLKPPEGNWWWHLEPVTHRLDRFDWAWQGLTLLLLTPSVSLLVDISSKFLATVPDTFGSFAIVGQSAMALLTGGALTEQGRKIIQTVLTSLRIPPYLWRETQALMSLVLLVSLLGFRLSLPVIAKGYMTKADTQRKDGQFSLAEANYKRALDLWPQMVVCNAKLGSLYEDLGELGKATEQYRLAVQGGEALAFNNLSRIYNIEGNYSEAFRILWTGLQQPEVAQEVARVPQVQMAWYKNMGWARYGQKRYAEADAYLTQAIALASSSQPGDQGQPSDTASQDNQVAHSSSRSDTSVLPALEDSLGSAHCLRAQVYTALQKTKDIATEWERCIQYANPSLPEADQWVGAAQVYMKSQPSADGGRTESTKSNGERR